MKKFTSIIGLFVLSSSLLAQDIDVEQTFKKGEDLFNNQNYSEALPYLEEAANHNNDEAQFLLGKMYQQGLGTEIDYTKAVKWYEKSIVNENAKALNNLGFMYMNELGVDKNYPKAKVLFEKAAEKGLGIASFNLGMLYFDGKGVAKDRIKALEYLKKAEEKGNTGAIIQMAMMYKDGNGVKQDLSTSFKKYLKAAELGDPLAQDMTGWMYAEGMGVKKDYSKAVKWYRKSADQNYAWGLQHLGFSYLNGLGVKKDVAEAAWLIRQAAEQGLEMAQLNMGLFYENGYGVTKDLNEAAEWYNKVLTANPDNKAAKQGIARVKPEVDTKEDTSNINSANDNNGVSIDASGTGFLIDKRGYLATNNHVTKGARGIYVCIQIDGIWKSYNAVLVKNDPTNDLSIIQIDDTNYKPFPSLPYNFTTDVEEVASEIYTLGYPQVHIMGTEVKYTTGAINSKSGVQGDPTHYQISAHIDHGNSGGPMFNSKGTIIGITDSGLDKAEFGDVNYAIKSSYLKSLVDALPVKLELPHDTSIEKLSRVEQIKVLSKFTALILIDLP